MRLFIGAVLTVMAITAQQARAAWLEAATDHFVIDADTTETRLRDFATRLERFDHALRRVYGVPDDPSRKSARVHVYAVSDAMITNLCRGCALNTAGFYRPRVSGSVIFTSTVTASAGVMEETSLDVGSQQVLLHEYSHHIMFSNFPGAYPSWFSEGFADFNANVLFQSDGSLYLGLPANYRARGLLGEIRLPMTSLLAPTPAEMQDPLRLELVYGRGWLLMHYMMLDKARRTQLNAYQRAVAAGTPSLQAGQQAFGDLSKLDAALDHYRDGRLNLPLVVPPAASPPVVIVKPLPPGAAAMMPVHLQSTNGVDAKLAAQLVPQAERSAAPFPNDPRVQVELAEAEFDADRDDEADSAADRVLKADPADITALLYKGRIAGRRLIKANSRDPDQWDKVRGWYAQANRIDTEDPLPLLYYYQSYLAQGIKPPQLAVDGLYKIYGLAPEDVGVRWLLAARLMSDGDVASTRAVLAPVAYAPHASGDNVALKIVELIDQGKIKDAEAAFPGKLPDKDKTAS